MAELDELRQYISSLTGKDVDSSILLSLLSYVKSFNGRKGPDIIPKSGDYDATQIILNPPIPDLEDDQLSYSNVYQMLSSLRVALNGFFKPKLLWGGVEWKAATNITLSESFMNFSELLFVYSNTGEGFVAEASSYMDCKSYPTPFLKNCLESTGCIALFGYSSRFIKYAVDSETSLRWIRNGDSGTTGVIAVYGIP